MIVAYSDASLTNGQVGIGCKLYQPPTSTDHGGSIDHCTHRLVENDEEYTSVMAEYLAVLEAAKIAKKFDTELLILASDCKGVVEKIKQGIPVTEDSRFRDELQEILSDFENWRIKHVKQELNTDAHNEARKAVKHSTAV